MNPRQFMRKFDPTALLAEHGVAYAADMPVDELRKQAVICQEASERLRLSIQPLREKLNISKQDAKERGIYTDSRIWVEMNKTASELGFQHQHLLAALGHINRLIHERTRYAGRNILDIAFIESTTERYGTRAADDLWTEAKARIADPIRRARYTAEGAQE